MLPFEILRLGKIIAGLAAILEINLDPDNEYGQHPIYQMFSLCMEYHNNRAFLGRDIETNKLGLLLINLQRIREKKPELFAEYKKLLLPVRDIRNYIGLRFEINIASSLIRDGVAFTTPDPPDFLLEFDGSRLGLECTTSHSDNNRLDIFRVKINRAIKNKAKKGYDKSTHLVLLINVTNTDYFASQGDLVEWGKTREEVFENMASIWAKYFESLIFFSYMQTDEGLHHAYRRCDTTSITKNVCDMLDKLYPRGEFIPKLFYIPEFG